MFFRRVFFGFQTQIEGFGLVQKRKNSTASIRFGSVHGKTPYKFPSEFLHRASLFSGFGESLYTDSGVIALRLARQFSER